MQTLIDTMKTRRSIRKYLPKPVPSEIILDLLESAGQAPSAHNSQPWRFIVLMDENPKHELAKAMAQVWRKHMKKDDTPEKLRESLIKKSIERFSEAPAIIIACITMQEMPMHKKRSAQLNERDMAVQSLSAAIQNILLTASSKKLGTCWYCTPLFCKIIVQHNLGMPHEIEPQALITLGYPAEDPPMPPRKPIEEYCFLNKWNQKLQ